MTARVIIPITGFRESRRHMTGVEKIRFSLQSVSGPNLLVMDALEWNEPMEEIVDYVLRWVEELRSASPVEIMVIAYSWGAGSGAIRLAEVWKARGVSIAYMVLCDPVYRWPWLPTQLPDWLQLCPVSISQYYRPDITIPANVRWVEWVRQAVDIPRGHDLVAENAKATHINLGRYLPYRHTGIDDSPEFQELVSRVVQAFIYDLDPRSIHSDTFLPSPEVLP